MRGHPLSIMFGVGREMHERYKISEAKFFLGRMEESVEDREAFRFYLSAFLSAARSVLQYAMKESREKGSQRWYDEVVSRNDVLSYFKDKRDVNIHEEPVNPLRHITMVISSGVFVFSAASEVSFNDKPIEMKRSEEKPPPPKPPESGPKNTVRYCFNDWTGPEDVIGLSHRYIEALESFVQRGLDERILSV